MPVVTDETKAAFLTEVSNRIVEEIKDTIIEKSIAELATPEAAEALDGDGPKLTQAMISTVCTELFASAIGGVNDRGAPEFAKITEQMVSEMVGPALLELHKLAKREG